MTAERLVEPGALLGEGPVHSILVHRHLVDAVVSHAGRRALHELRAGLRPRRGVPARHT